MSQRLPSLTSAYVEASPVPGTTATTQVIPRSLGRSFSARCEPDDMRGPAGERIQGACRRYGAWGRGYSNCHIHDLINA
jgi:hypothetical protein